MYRTLFSGSSLVLSGDNLTLADAGRILHGQIAELQLSPPARRRIEQARRCLHDLLARGDTLYGVNTGFGKLASQRIEAHEVLALQENLLRSHAVGMGPLLSLDISRLALALRIQALVKGHSGVTVELIDQLVEMYHRGVVPAIPEQGSVGASGDLAPLAHLALVVMGEGHAFVVRNNPAADTAGSPSRTKPMSGRAALRRVHLKPYRLQAKEGLSLINGTQISTALLAEALVRAEQLARVADIAGAMTVEATKSSRRPFDPRIQAQEPDQSPAPQGSEKNLGEPLTASPPTSKIACNRKRAGCGSFEDVLARIAPMFSASLKTSPNTSAPSAERRAPGAERRAPAPSAECRAPSAEFPFFHAAVYWR